METIHDSIIMVVLTVTVLNMLFGNKKAPLLLHFSACFLIIGFSEFVFFGCDVFIVLIKLLNKT